MSVGTGSVSDCSGWWKCSGHGMKMGVGGGEVGAMMTCLVLVDQPHGVLVEELELLVVLVVQGV